MKRLLIVIALLVVFGFAQTTPTASNSWNGIEEVQTVSQCVLHGSDSVLCIGTDGIEYSYQGAKFVTVGSGAQGPQGIPGPQGPAGATGPQGPAGPVQSFAEQQCTASNLSNSGFTASGCTEK